MKTRSLFHRAGKTALRAGLSLALASSSGAGCAPLDNRIDPTPIPTVMPKRLYSSTQCGFGQSRPGLRWIDSEPEWNQTYRRLTRMQGSTKAPPAVDFRDHGVLLVDMGTRPTSGYGLGLTDSALQKTRDATLVLPIQWHTPPPGAMLAQVLTNPCMLVDLPRGGYQRIRVLDQDGEERGNIELPAPR